MMGLARLKRGGFRRCDPSTYSSAGFGRKCCKVFFWDIEILQESFMEDRNHGSIQPCENAFFFLFAGYYFPLRAFCLHMISGHQTRFGQHGGIQRAAYLLIPPRKA